MYKKLLTLFLLLFLTLNVFSISTTGLMTYYNFEESSGDLIDVVDYDNNGSNTSVTYSETGIIGNAYKYINTSGSITTLTTTGFPTSSAQSVAFWTKMDPLGYEQNPYFLEQNGTTSMALP